MSDYSAVLRVSPLTSQTISGAIAHQDRESAGFENHIDSERSYLNEKLIGSNDTRADVEDVLVDYKKANSKGPIAVDGILTAGKDYFDKNYPGWRENKEVLKPWIDANKAFLESGKVGKVVSAVIHLDEETPHIHFIAIPVTKVKMKNRYGEKEEERISYGTLFSDTKKHLAICRRLGTTSTETKLGKLQTAYADAVKSVGLKRGITSEAKHTTPSQYREDINREKQSIQPLPEHLKDTDLAENLNLIDRFKLAKDLVLNGKDAGSIKLLEEAIDYGIKAQKIIENERALRVEVNMLKKENKMQKNTIIEKDKIIQDQIPFVAIEKERRDSLRKLDETSLKKTIGYTSEQISKALDGKKYNAINVVMSIEQMSLNDAVLTLNERFPDVGAISIVAAEQRADRIKEIAVEHNKPSKKNSMQIKQEKIMNIQLDAIGADKYRITLMHNDQTKPTINLGKAKDDGAEKFYTQSEIIEMSSTLAYRNSRGYNVFITPIPSENKQYLLIDDVINLSKAKELNPCIILQSSPKSQQALLKINGNFDNETMNKVFKQLNTENGDPKISAAIHPLRLAGFTNRKPKYEDERGYFPFVLLVDAKNTVSTKAEEMLRLAEKNLVVNKEKAIIKASTHVIQANYKVDTETKSVDSFSGYYLINRNNDVSAKDYGLAVRMLETGHSPAEIHKTIEKYSPEIHVRHKDVDAYITKTIDAVITKLETTKAQYAEQERQALASQVKTGRGAGITR